MRDEKVPSPAMVVKLLESNGLMESVKNLLLVQVNAIMCKNDVSLAPEQITSRIGSSRLVEVITETYSKHFNRDDVLDLISFYRSPAGQKMVSCHKALMDEMIDVIDQISVEVAVSLHTNPPDESPKNT